MNFICSVIVFVQVPFFIFGRCDANSEKPKPRVHFVKPTLMQRITQQSLQILTKALFSFFIFELLLLFWVFFNFHYIFSLVFSSFIVQFCHLSVFISI